LLFSGTKKQKIYQEKHLQFLIEQI
jgi:hypothetical protein